MHYVHIFINTWSPQIRRSILDFVRVTNYCIVLYCNMGLMTIFDKLGSSVSLCVVLSIYVQNCASYFSGVHVTTVLDVLFLKPQTSYCLCFLIIYFWQMLLVTWPLLQAAAELQQKIDLMYQIRALQAVPVSRQPKVTDFTFTSGCGLLCEMSIAEVCAHERSIHKLHIMFLATMKYVSAAQIMWLNVEKF